jgi:D-3-phosphoglycerate dehydrogenase
LGDALVKKFKVFIPEPEWEESHKILEEIAEVKVGNPGVRYSEDRLIEEIKDVDAVIITSQHRITRRVLEKANKLKVVVKYGSKPGMDNVDLKAATERGIIVSYTHGANSDSVAEYTIALILILLRKIFNSYSNLRQGRWRDESLLGHDLLGKTVGIIGLGSIGYKVAEKIKGFGVNLLAYTRASESAEKVGAKLVDLETLLKESDIVTIHTSLREDTLHLIGEEELKLMKRSAIIINTARGAIIDEGALIKALKEGWIAGAALDVFTEEPIKPDNPLLKMDNVILTPHVASFSYEAFQREAFTAAEEVLNVLLGRRPRFVVNPEVLSRT